MRLPSVQQTPPSKEWAKQHKNCSKVGRRPDFSEMDETQLHQYLRDVCNCCGLAPPQSELTIGCSVEEAVSVSLGAGLALLRIKVWTWITFIMLLLSLYMVIRNVTGSACLTRADSTNASVLAENVYVSKFGLQICPKQWITVHSFANFGFKHDRLEVVYYICMFICVIIGVRAAIYKEHSCWQEFLDKHHQASDWALRITPKTRLDETGLKGLIESSSDAIKLRIEVLRIIFPIDVSEIEEAQSDLKDLNLKMEEALQDQTGLDQDRVDSLKSQIKILKNSLSNLEQKAYSEMMESSTIPSALVIFRTKEMAHQVYKYWNPDLGSTVFGRQPNPEKQENKRLKVERAFPPEDIVWTNVGAKPHSAIKCIISVVFLTILALGIVGLVIAKVFNVAYNRKNQESNVYNTSSSQMVSLGLTLFVSGFKNLLVLVLNGIVYCSKPSSNSEYRSSVVTKTIPFYLFLALIAIPAAYPFYSRTPDLWQMTGPLDDLWFLILIACLLEPLKILISVGHWWAVIKRNKTLKKLEQDPHLARGTPQQDLNDWMSGMEFEPEKSELDIVIMGMTVCFCITVLPIGSIVMFLGLVLSSYTQRFTLTRLCRQPKTRFYQPPQTAKNYLYAIYSIPYGFFLLYFSFLSAARRSSIVSDAIGAVLIVIIGILNLYDLGFSKYLDKKGLLIPWSHKGYKDLDYREVQHLLESCYERLYIPTRERTFETLIAKVQTDPKLSDPLKACYVRRLSIQQNVAADIQAARILRQRTLVLDAARRIWQNQINQKDFASNENAQMTVPTENRSILPQVSEKESVSNPESIPLVPSTQQKHLFPRPPVSN